MKQIQLTMTIAEIIKEYPETREVFVNNGFAMFNDDEIIQELGILKWLGWDFIKNNDMKYLVETMNETFMKVYRAGGKGVCN